MRCSAAATPVMTSQRNTVSTRKESGLPTWRCRRMTGSNVMDVFRASGDHPRRKCKEKADEKGD